MLSTTKPATAEICPATSLDLVHLLHQLHQLLVAGVRGRRRNRIHLIVEHNYRDYVVGVQTLDGADGSGLGGVRWRCAGTWPEMVRRARTTTPAGPVGGATGW